MGELWAKREVDCKAFKPFDEMFEKIYSEMKVPLSPPLSLSPPVTKSRGGTNGLECPRH